MKIKVEAVSLEGTIEHKLFVGMGTWGSNATSTDKFSRNLTYAHTWRKGGPTPTLKLRNEIRIARIIAFHIIP
jgi:hypothetical protein